VKPERLIHLALVVEEFCNVAEGDRPFFCGPQLLIHGDSFSVKPERLIHLSLVSQDSCDVAERNRPVSCRPQLLEDGELLAVKPKRLIHLALGPKNSRDLTGNGRTADKVLRVLHHRQCFIEQGSGFIRATVGVQLSGMEDQSDRIIEAVGTAGLNGPLEIIPAVLDIADNSALFADHAKQTRGYGFASAIKGFNDIVPQGGGSAMPFALVQVDNRIRSGYRQDIRVIGQQG
jgi:hypothetical protein